MNAIDQKTQGLIVAAMAALLVAGCADSGTRGSGSLLGDTDLGDTIGMLADVSIPEPIALEGFGLVGGLNGTGSAECPSGIRAYLTRYILTQLPQHSIDVQRLIASSATAVVRVQGETPSLASRGQRFDVRVMAIEGTQTTSLEGGWLYGSELKPVGRFLIGAPAVANAGGPVYIDKLEGAARTPRTGCIMAGGKVANDYILTISLRNRDYELTNIIRNRVNGRFGYDTAGAGTPGRILVRVPGNYSNRKEDFAEVLKALYVDVSVDLVEARIKNHVRQLGVERDKYGAELALEAIGNPCLRKLQVLLSSSDEETRFHAARCMLNLGSDEGFEYLRQMALDAGSPLRLEALEAVVNSASRNDASSLARTLLRDKDVDIRLAAYEQLRKLDDVSVVRETIAEAFHLERIGYAGGRTIFVSRSGQPRVVLFGSPLYCREGSFIQSADGTVIVNASRGQQYVSVIRKHPRRSSEVMNLKSSFKLSDIIRVLGSEPGGAKDSGPGGLGVPYSEIAALLRQMCDKGAVVAEFRAGPPAKFGPIVKK